jgi:peptidoglycan hydrolase CwlO-like protein
VSLPSILEIGLVASITGITAVSIFTLYLQDRLTGKVERLELTSLSVDAQKMSTSKANVKTEVAPQIKEVSVPKEKAEESSVAELQTLAKGVVEITSKIDSLLRDFSDTKRRLKEADNNVALTNVRLGSLELQLSETRKRINEAEDTFSNIVKNILERNPEKEALMSRKIGQ